MATLIHYKNNQPGVRLALDKSPFRIGRGEVNDLCVDDDLASRQHATVEMLQRGGDAGTEYVLRDSESTNGTFVNGARISAHLLVEGDLIRIGRTFLKFAVDADGAFGETRLMKRLLPGVFYTIDKPDRGD